MMKSIQKYHKMTIKHTELSSAKLAKDDITRWVCLSVDRSLEIGGFEAGMLLSSDRSDSWLF